MSNHIVVRFLETYGRLHILREVARRVYSGEPKRAVECICDCGNTMEVVLNSLRRGLTKSCGCWQYEVVKSIHVTHGASYSVEYRTRSLLINRCRNKNFKQWKDYGGRGITVCQRWLDSYENFLEDILREIGRRPGPEYSIDRKNNNGNYEPGNVRWATRIQQGRNKRNNIHVNHAGRKRLMIEVSQESALNYDTVRYRYHAGYPDEALFDPVQK